MAHMLKGSKEYIQVTGLDSSGSVTDLSSSSPHFDVYEGSGTGGAHRITNQAATATGMVINCLVDTSSGTWNTGLHSLYVKFTVGSEAPMFGPFELYIN